jgi:diguanylate cyclase (GGDEF)-like protein
MPGRILVVEESRPVLAALRRGAQAAGFRADASSMASAPEKHDPERHAAAIVRAGPRAAALVATLRRADPTLAVLALYEDEEQAEARGGAEALGADGVLVGPLTSAAIASACALAARVREQARRIAALEAVPAATAAVRGELEFLKRLLFLEVRRSRRYRYPIGLALVALDFWPVAAARMGKRARTRLLGEVLGVFSAAIRNIDVAVPFAEDRFVVLMPHTRAEGALEVSRRLCARIREREGTPRVTASAGVAAHHGEGPVSFSALVKRARDALSRAQAAGGDRAEGEPPRRRGRAEQR